MKKLLSVFLAVVMTVLCVQPVLSVSAADARLLYATVGNNNTHLLPRDYQKTVNKYNAGTLKETKKW